MENNSEDKKPAQREQESRRRGAMTYKQFKGEVIGLEEYAYESRAVKHAAQFTKISEAIANYVQVNYNTEVANAIRKLARPKFEMPSKPEHKKIISEDGKVTFEDYDEVDIFMWKKRHKTE